MRLHHHAFHIKSTTILWGIYQCCHCTPDCTKVPLLGCDTLQTFLCTMVGNYRTFLAFEDGLRCRFRHYNHPFKGWKLVLETIYFEGWCTSKEVEKVLKVKLKFRGSKSGRPTDDLLWSSGRPTAILGVRTPGRPLTLHAVIEEYWENMLINGNFCQYFANILGIILRYYFYLTAILAWNFANEVLWPKTLAEN